MSIVPICCNDKSLSLNSEFQSRLLCGLFKTFKTHLEIMMACLVAWDLHRHQRSLHFSFLEPSDDGGTGLNPKTQAHIVHWLCNTFNGRPDLVTMYPNCYKGLQNSPYNKPEWTWSYYESDRLRDYCDYMDDSDHIYYTDEVPVALRVYDDV